MTLEVDVTVRREAFELRASFEATAGETVALLGPNGAGKSTLVGVLTGIVAPDAGTVRLDGEMLDDVDGDRHVAPEARPIGVMFQDLLLLPHLTAEENVAFPLRARGTSAGIARTSARRALEALSIGERAAAKPGALSGGQAQRVALARALIGDPRLLLLDEPTSALDVSARGRIRELLASTLSQFDGVRVLVTHDPVEAMTLADRLVVLENGGVTQTGTPDEVRAAPRTTYAADLVGVNLYRGNLEPIGEPDAGRLHVAGGGELIASWPDDIPVVSTEVIALIRPADVVVHAVRPEGSARNVLHGTVATIAADGERARVRLSSTPPIVAEVTRDSIGRLRLTEGAAAWASVKAVEIRVVSA
ncbi:MAG: ABC transporter ATP-binding protein [Actinomycetota bacterium]